MSSVGFPKERVDFDCSKRGGDDTPGSKDLQMVKHGKP